MKRIYLTIVASLMFSAMALANELNISGVHNLMGTPMTSASQASTDGLYINAFNTLPNTATTVSVCMKNTNVISGFQFDLVLPSGVTLNSVTASKARTSYTYSISQKTQSNGNIRIVCISTGSADAKYTGTDGEVLTLSLTSTSTGNKTITLQNQIFTESDLDEVEPANASVTMHVHSVTATAAKAATCTTAGNTAYWYCSGCSKYYSNATCTTETTQAKTVISAIGHNYGDAVWTWADDGKTASAKITCANDASHTLSGNATVTSAVKTAATCTVKGTTTYTAKVTLNNKEYTSTKDVQDIAATGHTYSTTPTWSWTGLTSAKATFACTSNDDTQEVGATIANAVTTASTCTSAGVRTYTATATFGGKTYTDSKTEAIAALGHNYGDAVWTWSDDGKTASAKITCANDASHVLSGNATVTSAVKTSSTCTVKGTTTYTAKVTLNGKEYTSTKDVQDIAAIGHSYGDAAWTWSDDGKTASAKITCANDASHTLSGNATVTSAVKTSSTCTVKGTTSYTAKVTLNNKEYTSTKDVQDISVLGHNYGDAVWTWSDDGKTASAKITCANDASHVLSGNATVTSAVKTAATCTVKGTTTYTAKVTLNGKEYYNTPRFSNQCISQINFVTLHSK